MPPQHAHGKHGRVDKLQRFLNGLRIPEDKRDAERGKLAAYIELERRDLTSEEFLSLENEVYTRLNRLAGSSQDADKRTAILAVEELIEVKHIIENSTWIRRLAHAAFRVIDTCSELKMQRRAAAALGKVISAGETLAAETVKEMITGALDALEQNKLHSTCTKRLGACLVLRELAEHAPAVFNVFVKRFIDLIWYGLRDARLEIRQNAVAALRQCLLLLLERETRYRVQWWYALFEQTMRVLVRPFRQGDKDVEANVHASLLTLGELLSHTREFMLARYKEAVDTVISLRESRHMLVKQAVMLLIPRMAAFAPEKFVLSYLDVCVSHLVQTLSVHAPHANATIQAASLSALGQMAITLEQDGLAKHLKSRLPEIATHIHALLVSKSIRDASRKAVCQEALSCVGVLAEALGVLWLPHISGLVKPMILCGLSECLYKSLLKISRKLSAERARLLDAPPGKAASNGRNACNGEGEPVADTVAVIDSTLEMVQLHLLQPVLIALPGPDDAAAAAAAGGGAGEAPPRNGAGGSRLQLGQRRQPLSPTANISTRELAEFSRKVEAQITQQLTHAETSVARRLQKLALDTLRDFDFGQYLLLDFVHGTVLAYAAARSDELRKSAALASWHVTQRQWSRLVAMTGRGELPMAGLLEHQVHAEAAVRRLLTLAASDVEVSVRRAIMEALRASFRERLGSATLLRGARGGGATSGAAGPGLEVFFVQAENIRALDVCLNDLNQSVRLAALQLLGLFEKLNPAAVTPVLRRHLHQLLTDTENCVDYKQLEDTVNLLSALISECPALIRPNIGIVHDKLVRKLDDARARIKARGDVKSKSGYKMTKSILLVINVLVQRAGVAYRRYVDAVMPLVVDAILDHRTDLRTALAAMELLAEISASTGAVIEPYIQYPRLMKNLMSLLDQQESSSVSGKEVVKVLGIVGALDPHRYKQNLARLTGEDKLDKDGVRGMRGDKFATDGTDEKDLIQDPLSSIGLMTQSEDFYPTVAINALLKQLRDSKMVGVHTDVVQALMFIFRSLGVNGVPYLGRVLPALFAAVRAPTAEEALVQFIFKQLIELTNFVQAHMRRYLPELMALLTEHWSSARPALLQTLLQLLQQLAAVLQDDLRAYMPDLVPKLEQLFVDADRSENFTLVEPALEALKAMGLALDGHFHILLPSLVRLLSAVHGQVVPAATRERVLGAMAALLPRLRLAPFSSAVLHPLICTLRDAAEADVKAAALTTICAVAVAIGESMSLFVPSIQAVMRECAADVGQAAPAALERWRRLEGALSRTVAPCMSESTEWDGARGWAAEMDAVQYSARRGVPVPSTPSSLPVSQDALKRAWESSHRCTKADWVEWMRHLSVELLAQSASPALRACHALALHQPSMARELFAVGFVSCWLEIDEAHQRELVRSLEAALASPSIPPEIVTNLLNLAEFMEHDERPLPLDHRTLGALAEKCGAYAKALHYKELEYQRDPLGCTESLITICNHLRLPDAAVGILHDAQRMHRGHLSEAFHERLRHYDLALAEYARKAAPIGTVASPAQWQAQLGMMRCYGATHDWRKLLDLCQTLWKRADALKRLDMAHLAAHAAWHMHDWHQMRKYVHTMSPPGKRETNSDKAFLRAALYVKLDSDEPGRAADFSRAVGYIKETREALALELAALVNESYDRAYADLIRAQQCAELYEVIHYLRAASTVAPQTAAASAASAAVAVAPAAASALDDALMTASEERSLIREVWRRRIQGVEASVDVWQALLAVRSHVLDESDETDLWLKFASMARKEGKQHLASRTLSQLLGGVDLDAIARGAPGYMAAVSKPEVMLGYLKHRWYTRTAVAERRATVERLQDLLAELEADAVLASKRSGFAPPSLASSDLPSSLRTSFLGHRISDTTALRQSTAHLAAPGHLPSVAAATLRGAEKYRPTVLAKAYLYYARWLHLISVADSELSDERVAEINRLHVAAIEATEDKRWAKAWHTYGLFNTMALRQYSARRGAAGTQVSLVVNAVRGFFESVALSASNRNKSLQDVLRLLTLWFSYGKEDAVYAELMQGFSKVPIDTWLVVVPQMMARLHMSQPAVVQPIIDLLVKIGRNHPQALMYPLLVAKRSASTARQHNAQRVMDEIKSHSPLLVEQTELVSEELIRIAILWPEQWHEALEEASRLYFGEADVDGMLGVLLPLHERLAQIRGEGGVEALDARLTAADGVTSDGTRPLTTTVSEAFFLQMYGKELEDAYGWCKQYQASKRDSELQKAWDIYYHIFRRINKQLRSLTSLDLANVAPALVRAQGLELAVPGTYKAGEPVVTIAQFASKLQVITSKQRPRKLTVTGGDGAEYQFLLKGHEDLRLDERVMQLFGLVNNLLAEDRASAERNLSIARYAVIPLSPNSGLIGWVRNCDTLHQLIREYRESRRVVLNVEHRIMQSMAPDYDQLMVIQKVEVFEAALEATSGEDLHKVLWLKSRNSEMWLDRRTNYTRSTAVMSMVGYLLGLGDRHPSNLMLDRFSGKLVHIDFGDCFEASMTREKFPEKVPFRLTRMMVKAMEVCGIRGSFHTTCVSTMSVLREERITVMAMLEAFVHDPLINWRLLQSRAVGHNAHTRADTADLQSAGTQGSGVEEPRISTEAQDLQNFLANMQEDAKEALTERATTVMARLVNKLEGRDFQPSIAQHGSLTPQAQVDALIAQATSHERLCQSYVGWCPFW